MFGIPLYHTPKITIWLPNPPQCRILCHVFPHVWPPFLHPKHPTHPPKPLPPSQRMPIDCPTHRDKLQKLQTYVATASFIANSSWAPEKTGHVLINKANQEEQIGIGVAKVMNHKLFCGPEGNCNVQFKDKSPLQKAKYTFTVCRPDEPAFHDDYDKLFSNLDRVQVSISYGKDHRNMLDGVTKTIQFSAPVFEKRVNLTQFNIILKLTTTPRKSLIQMFKKRPKTGTVANRKC